MKVSDISKLLRVTPPTVTQILKGLEADGLVEREIDPTDRRVAFIKLTKKGELVTVKAREASLADFEGLVEYLGEERSNQLADLLTDVFAYFHEREASLHQAQWSGDKIL